MSLLPSSRSSNDLIVLLNDEQTKTNRYAAKRSETRSVACPFFVVFCVCSPGRMYRNKRRKVRSRMIYSCVLGGLGGYSTNKQFALWGTICLACYFCPRLALRFRALSQAPHLRCPIQPFGRSQCSFGDRA